MRGGVDSVSKWAASGVVPLRVIPLDGWTAALPAGESRAAAPYDACLPMLAARRVPGRLRAALGFFVIDGKAVITVQPRGLRAQARFVGWEPESGVMRSPGLPVARPQDLQRAARRPGPRAARALRDLLRSPGDDARSLLAAAMVTLDLPGGELLGAAPSAGIAGSFVVEPAPRAVSGFDSAAQDEIALRAELGLDR
jgi:hypothetical protein